MLGYLSRMLPTLLREVSRRPTGERSVRTSHRVSLRQVDLNRHMNQAAYAQVCEEARIAWLFRSGAYRGWRAQGINPVVGRQELVYRRELAPLQRFAMDVRAVGMDGRLLRIDHLFLVGDRVHARCDLGLLLVGPRGVLSADEAEAACAHLITAPVRVEDWRVA